MTALQEVLDELDTGRWTAPTAKSAPGPLPPMRRTPEDGTAEAITLRRRLGTEIVTLRGARLWELAQMILSTWALDVREPADELAEFAIAFRDGEGFFGWIGVREDLGAHCRRLDTFVRCFAPALGEREATAMQRMFFASYAIPESTMRSAWAISSAA